eukprot:354227-Chlamydomonas_euryale.AAC.2
MPDASIVSPPKTYHGSGSGRVDCPSGAADLTRARERTRVCRWWPQSGHPPCGLPAQLPAWRPAGPACELAPQHWRRRIGDAPPSRPPRLADLPRWHRQQRAVPSRAAAVHRPRRQRHGMFAWRPCQRRAHAFQWALCQPKSRSMSRA